jgi:hypothetical protein
MLVGLSGIILSFKPEGKFAGVSLQEKKLSAIVDIRVRL